MSSSSAWLHAPLYSYVWAAEALLHYCPGEPLAMALELLEIGRVDIVRHAFKQASQACSPLLGTELGACAPTMQFRCSPSSLPVGPAKRRSCFLLGGCCLLAGWLA